MDRPAIITYVYEYADAPGAVVRSLVDLVGPDAALADARGSLERLAEELARDGATLGAAQG